MEDKSLVKNAADEGQVGKAAAKEKRGRHRDLDDVKALLAMKPGRRFIWRYLSESGLFRTSFSTNGSQTSFNEGMRNVGLTMLADISEANPDAFVLMQRESKEDF